jgi:type VI secretion system secreted protein VgrG
MRLHALSILVLVFVLPSLAVSAYADTLGPALDPFAVLGGSSVTNASGGGVGVATVITGSLGVSPGTSITGFPPGMVVGGTIENNTGNAAAAQLGLTAAIGNLDALGSPILVGAQGLSGASLGPGTYNVASSGTFDMLAGSTLTLTMPGQYVFRMTGAGTLTLASGVTIDTSALDATSSVYWLAPDGTTAVTLGDNADFQGNILANGSIIFDPGATVGCGRALSQNKLVSFAGVGTSKETGEGAPDPNLVGGGCTGNLVNSGGLNGGGPGPGPVSTPEPSTFALLSSGLAIALVALRKSR